MWHFHLYYAFVVTSVMSSATTDRTCTHYMERPILLLMDLDQGLHQKWKCLDQLISVVN